MVTPVRFAGAFDVTIVDICQASNGLSILKTALDPASNYFYTGDVVSVMTGEAFSTNLVNCPIKSYECEDADTAGPCIYSSTTGQVDFDTLTGRLDYMATWQNLPEKPPRTQRWKITAKAGTNDDVIDSMIYSVEFDCKIPHSDFSYTTPVSEETLLVDKSSYLSGWSHIDYPINAIIDSSSGQPAYQVDSLCQKIQPVPLAWSTSKTVFDTDGNL